MTDQVGRGAQAEDGRRRGAGRGVPAGRGAAARGACAGMDADTLRARPIAGKMSSLEVLCHLADCEQFLADRMKRTIGDGQAAARRHRRDRPTSTGSTTTTATRSSSCGSIEVTREQMAADLDRIGADAWQRTAVHTETGLVTLRQLLLHTIRHLEWHADAVREKRTALSATSGRSALPPLTYG